MAKEYDDEESKKQTSFLLSQGARAGRSGKFGEFTIEAGFKAYGVDCVEDNPSYYDDAQMWPRNYKVLIKQARLKFRRLDYLYMDFARNLKIPIECKNQMGGGSTDEKLAYTVDRLLDLNFSTFWLVLSGDGFADQVVAHIRKKIDVTPGKGRLIVNRGPFLQWAIEALVDHGTV